MKRQRRGSSRHRLFAVLIFTCGLALGLTHLTVEIDTVGSQSAGGWAFIDFRDAFYYPGVALLDGKNPYASSEYSDNYPVASPYPLYSPAALLLHLPFSLLPYRVAQVADVLINVVAVLLLSVLALRIAGLKATLEATLTVAGFILLTRPGEQNLFLGQCTLYVIAGVYLALLFARTRPGLAGVGLAIAAIKPTIGAPLALLMLCRGDRKAVVVGAAVSAVAVAIMLVPLLHVAGGFDGLIASINENYAVFRRNPKVDAITSPLRADLVALIARLSGRSLSAVEEVMISAAILAASAWAIRRRARHADSSALTAAYICIAVFVCTYHLSYDAVILAAPMVALIGRPQALHAIGSRPLWRWTSLGLLLVPALNYFASEMGLLALGASPRTWWVATSATSAAVGALFLLWLLVEALTLQPVADDLAADLRRRRPLRGIRLAGVDE